MYMDKLILIAGLVGYGAAALGMVIGALLSLITTKKGKRFQGTVMGFTAGLMIAVVCFDLLPEAFERGGLYIGVIGILAGVLITTLVDNKISSYTSVLRQTKSSRYLKTGILLALGFSIHSLPEGMAIGSLLVISFSAGIRLAIIIALHCIPEGIAVSIPLKEGGISIPRVLLYALLLAIPKGIGSLIGCLISEISAFFVTLCLGVAGGVMLYITCGEILPESKELWGGRLSTLGALLGIVAGIIITSNIH